ncbi:MAG: MarR family winged helix-turn-helix transcriptional regulator [Pseudomonadota bacterium]|nr:MarR family winged helix-turn-helix transcriptional regulator [Pseudomonadota bacterium]
MTAPNLIADGTTRSSCTCFTLRKLARNVSRLYDLHLATVDLKTTQYSLLKNIAHQALPVAQLALRLATERTTLTRNLKPLLGAGWATLADGADARQRIVTITAAGRAKLASAHHAWHAAQTELDQILGPDLVGALHENAAAVMAALTPLLSEKLHVEHH